MRAGAQPPTSRMRPSTDSTPNPTHVVVNWSTNLTSGLVLQSDLTNWSIGLFGGGNVFYTSNVITVGTVQYNVGLARGIADVLFHFNLDTGVPREFDNMLAGTTLSSAVGTAYNIYSYPTSTQGPPFSWLGLWKNGDESTRQLPGYLSVSTVAVPAPGAIAFLGMASLIERRRR